MNRITLKWIEKFREIVKEKDSEEAIKDFMNYCDEREDEVNAGFGYED